MFKILQARLQQYVNCELPDIHTGFRKTRGTRDQIVNICEIIEKARELRKNIYLLTTPKSLTVDQTTNWWITTVCVDHNKLWKILKQVGLPEHRTCLLRNLYAGQAATTEHGTTDWFQIGKGVRQGCILSPCLFSLYAEYIM